MNAEELIKKRYQAVENNKKALDAAKVLYFQNKLKTMTAEAKEKNKTKIANVKSIIRRKESRLNIQSITLWSLLADLKLTPPTKTELDLKEYDSQNGLKYTKRYKYYTEIIDAIMNW